MEELRRGRAHPGRGQSSHPEFDGAVARSGELGLETGGTGARPA
jgi:hypothetical protein